MTYLKTDKEVKSDLTDSRASRLIDKINNVIFRSFDDFTSCTDNIFFSNVDQSRDEGYSCTCKQNAKELSCIQSVGIAIICGTLVPPRRAMVTLLGRKRKVGRKPMAAPAWEHQSFEIDTPPAHPEQNVSSLVWRYTHCTYVQYVLVCYKYACYSEPLITICDGPS